MKIWQNITSRVTMSLRISKWDTNLDPVQKYGTKCIGWSSAMMLTYQSDKIHSTDAMLIQRSIITLPYLMKKSIKRKRLADERSKCILSEGTETWMVAMFVVSTMMTRQPIWECRRWKVTSERMEVINCSNSAINVLFSPNEGLTATIASVYGNVLASTAHNKTQR